MTKRALVVGINDYPGTGSDLYGCVNDAYDWRDALDNHGHDEIGLLLDADATRENILKTLKVLLDRSQSGDLLTFTNSSHGTWVPGRGGDEPRDEAICPYDIRSAGPITDDELFGLFSQRSRGVRVVMVADSCFSGDLQRLAGPLSDAPRFARFLPPSAWLSPEQQQDATYWRMAERASVARTLRSGALVLAGCGEQQVCYDASFEGRPNGAFTYVALKALAELPAGEVNYRAWMRVIRKYLPSTDFEQRPQLDGLSHQKGWPVLEDGEDD